MNSSMTDASKELFGDSVRFAELGGLAQMGDATGNPMVLTMSIWDDVGFLFLFSTSYKLKK